MLLFNDFRCHAHAAEASIMEEVLHGNHPGIIRKER